MAYRFGYIAILLSLLYSCKQQVDHQGRIPLVEVDGVFLYKDDIEKVLPSNTSKDDSLLFAEQYVKNWIEDILLFHNAERNIPEDVDIEQLIENYRRSLILHTYQQNLISQKFVEEITEKEIETFYQENKELFLLDKPLVKGLFIKVPLKAPKITNVRQWYRTKEQDAIEKLEKYSLQYAVDYDYFYDHWIPLEEIVSKIPLSVSSPTDYTTQKRQIEMTDTLYHYFLNIDDVLEAGQHKPLDFARSEIKGILLNVKQVAFMQQIRSSLYKQAIDKDKIKFYY